MDRLRGQAYVHTIQRPQYPRNRIVVKVRSVEVHELGQIQLGLSIDLVQRIVRDGRVPRVRRGSSAQLRNFRGYGPPANRRIFREEFQTVGLRSYFFFNHVYRMVGGEASLA